MEGGEGEGREHMSNWCLCHALLVLECVCGVWRLCVWCVEVVCGVLVLGC